MTTLVTAGFELVEARTARDLDDVRRLFRAYADWLAVDLCFQDFEGEVAGLPGIYAPPAGQLLLARKGAIAIGCVGLRPLAPEICEMKRLWVEPGHEGHGIGRTLADAIVTAARAIGYRRMRLDTMPERLHAAQHIYRTMGFRPIADYYDNPLDGVVMFELEL